MIYIRGKPYKIDVDDIVRYTSHEGGPFYARFSKTLPSLWGPLIEKAWAKSFSNYRSLGRGGFSTQSMRALTGAPTDKFYLGRFRKYPWYIYNSINNAKL